MKERTVKIPSNWQDILGDLGYRLIKNGNNIRTSAVWRNGSTATSISIDPERGTFYDFGEKIGGTLTKLIALTKGIDEGEVAEALQYIEKRPAVRINQALNIPRTYSDECLTRLTKDYSYFKDRKISEDTQRVFEAHYCNKETMAGRVVFPIRNFQNKIIGFSGRSVKWTEGSKFPKWLILRPKRFFVFNHKISTPAIKDQNRVILVESIGDVLSLYEAGIHNSLCLFGLNISPAIIKYLISLSPEIVIATNKDGVEKDSHGEKAAEDIKKLLLKYFNKDKVKISLPDGDFNNMLVDKGPDSIRKWYENLLQKSENVIEYKQFSDYYA